MTEARNYCHSACQQQVRASRAVVFSLRRSYREASRNGRSASAGGYAVWAASTPRLALRRPNDPCARHRQFVAGGPTAGFRWPRVGDAIPQLNHGSTSHSRILWLQSRRRFDLACSFVRSLRHVSDVSCIVRNMCHISDMATLTQDTGLRSQLLARVATQPDQVWVPGDFSDLGNRPAIDKTLQRLVASGDLRRIDRGLYDRPRINDLTGRPTVPDYRAVIRAVTRRDQARALIDGMTAANELGLTTAVPARIEVLVDARLKPIKLGNQAIHFRYAAPSRLYWAGRPAMRVVQALHWMQDMLSEDSKRQHVEAKLRGLFADPRHGKSICDDLRAGLPALPIWMQEFLRGLLIPTDADAPRR